MEFIESCSGYILACSGKSVDLLRVVVTFIFYPKRTLDPPFLTCFLSALPSTHLLTMIYNMHTPVLCTHSELSQAARQGNGDYAILNVL